MFRQNTRGKPLKGDSRVESYLSVEYPVEGPGQDSILRWWRDILDSYKITDSSPA